MFGEKKEEGSGRRKGFKKGHCCHKAYCRVSPRSGLPAREVGAFPERKEGASALSLSTLMLCLYQDPTSFLGLTLA